MMRGEAGYGTRFLEERRGGERERAPAFTREHGPAELLRQIAGFFAEYRDGRDTTVDPESAVEKVIAKMKTLFDTTLAESDVSVSTLHSLLDASLSSAPFEETGKRNDKASFLDQEYAEKTLAHFLYEQAGRIIERIAGHSSAENVPMLIAFLQEQRMSRETGSRHGMDALSLLEAAEVENDHNVAALFDTLSARAIRGIATASGAEAADAIQKLFAESALYQSASFFPFGNPQEIFDRQPTAKEGAESYFRGLYFADTYGPPREIALTQTRAALLDALEQLPISNEEKMTSLFSWIDSDPGAFLFREEIASFFAKLDRESTLSAVAARERAETSPHRKALYHNLFFRLDTAARPATETGVTVAGTQYDLGEWNAHASVRTVTQSGSIGVFDSTGVLARLFAADTAGEGLVRPDLFTVSVDDLFFPTPNETDAERAEKEVLRTRFLDHALEQTTRDLFSQSGIELSVLSLREQVAVVRYLEGLDQEEKSRFFRLMTDYQTDGLRVLLAEPPEIALTAVENMAEKYGMWEARDLFAEYAAVAQNAESFYEQLAPFFRERLGDAFDARAWFAHLIERGKEFLTLAQAVGQTHKGVQRVAYEDEEATGYTLVYDRATKAELRQILQERFPHLTIASCREAIVQQGASDLANTFGAENTRVILGTIPDATAAAIQRYMTPEIPGVVVEDLRRLYDDIHFETYALNERVVAEEIAWLKDVLLKEQPVLDAGCGTGRLLVPLAQAGYDIRGVDLVSRHVAETKAQLIATGSATTETASERVREGSWTDLPHESNTFGSVVMLGRNILHEVGIDGQTRLFAEVARVLQDGGTFVFDIPAATIPGSYYKTMVDGYVEAMRARGITNTRRGTIVDSPDGEHFATRYVYHHEDILALAAGAGFAVVAVEEKDLPTGKGDKNRYYRLQKQAADNSRSAIRPIQPLVHERAA